MSVTSVDPVDLVEEICSKIQQAEFLENVSDSFEENGDGIENDIVDSKVECGVSGKVETLQSEGDEILSRCCDLVKGIPKSEGDEG